MHLSTGLIGPDEQRSTGSGSNGPPTGPFAVLTTDEFVHELTVTLARARADVALQLMTFDGDDSGLAVAGALVEAALRGVRVRLLVDCFAHRFVSDRPVRRREVVAEYRRTRAMYDELVEAGVALRFTHPNGPANLFALARNHKKLYQIDDVVYLGGINISDHNFGWHDFMIRVDDPAVHRSVVDDFEASFAGRSGIGGIGTDGPIVTNQALRRTFDELVAGARHRIVIASPYALDRRVAGLLEARPDLQRSLVIAEHNNFRCLQLITPYLTARMARAGVELATFGRFSHAKFVLVDDDALLIGSSNFGRHSLSCNQEIGLVIRDREFIAAFEASMLGDLVPLASGARRRQRLTGWVASALIDHCLIVYARLIAPHVPPLFPASEPTAVAPWRRRFRPARSGRVRRRRSG